MPAPQLPLFPMPKPTLRHIVIPTDPNSLDYSRSSKFKPPLRNIERTEHADSLIRQIGVIEGELQNIQRDRIANSLPEQVDLIVELESAPGFPLSPEHIHFLTTASSISLLHARQVTDEHGDSVTHVLLHVPYGSLQALSEKVRRYGEELTKLQNIPNSWVANLERIGIAALKSLWTDPEPLPTDDAMHWWELWVRRSPSSVLSEFEHCCQESQIRLKPPHLKLPDHVVVIAEATRADLESSLVLLNTLAEVRKAHPCSLGLTDLSSEEQQGAIQEALTRISFPGPDAPSVCILDTGINRGHPLLEPILSEQDNSTIFPDGDSSDSWHGDGHGTPMAGLAAYGDLRSLMLSSEPWIQSHGLEGVKMIDPDHPHEPENYGAVTKDAIFRPEVNAAMRKRVYSMALTADGPNDGRPTAWAAAVDSAAFGAEEDGEPKRLILVSAGNAENALAPDFCYPQDNHFQPIQDPAQAWNAITVGAITHRVEIKEKDPESRLLTAIAQNGALSPFSRTGTLWNSHWPIKPEVVMEGGNAGLHPRFGPERRDSLEPLSTSRAVAFRPIAPINATSAATALAGRLAAQLRVAYPDFWPETIRALIVHSARWNEEMLGGINPFQAFSREGRAHFVHMLRTYGFGEPDEARARFSSEQAVTLLREDSITPYKGSAGSASLNKCHIHHLRIPTQKLLEYPDATCTMRVTLSHFAAPNPSSQNQIGGSRYRYAGGLLRFLVRHKDETVQEFENRYSSDANDENGDQDDTRALADQSWALGAKLRGKGGSIVHDVWQGSAADLSQMDRIAIYPVKGWWAYRSFPPGSPWHKCHRKPIRYSLVVSIEINADVHLYTEISNLLNIHVET